VIELFFDFISPYSYLACMRVRELGARVGHDVEPRPVLLAGLLNAHGTKGPAEVPARRAYVLKDVLRQAHRAGVEIHLPPTHPFNPLAALRVAAVVVDLAERWRIIDALFATTWGGGRVGGGRGIELPEHVSDVLREAGLDAERLMALGATPEAKERLRANTDEALRRGTFGVPTMFIGDEMFFGFDSFGAIEGFVRGDDPVLVRADLLARWATLPASAKRRP
jgi:2-hydroxychromene-2-carboxylate isomerase